MRAAIKVRPDQKNIKLFLTTVALLKHVITWQEKKKSGDFFKLISTPEDNKLVSEYIYRDNVPLLSCIVIVFCDITALRRHIIRFPYEFF